MPLHSDTKARLDSDCEETLVSIHQALKEKVDTPDWAIFRTSTVIASRVDR